MSLYGILYVLFIVTTTHAMRNHHNGTPRGFTISPTHFIRGVTNRMTLRCDLGNYVHAVSKPLVLQLSKVNNQAVATLATEQLSGNGPVLVATSLKDRSSLDGKIDSSDLYGTYLQMSLTEPSHSDSGQYMCTITAMDHTGFVQIITVNSSVTYENATVDNLLTHVNHLHDQIEQLNTHADHSKNHTAKIESRLALLEGKHRNATDKSMSLEGELERLVEDVRQMRSGLANTNNMTCPASCVNEIGNVESRVNDTTTSIKTDISDLLYAQDKKSHVVFFAHHANAPGGHIPLHHSSIIAFGDVVINEGGGYNNKTGTFVAPVNGTYLFMLNIPVIDKDASRQVNIAVTVNFDQNIAQIENGPDKVPNSVTVVRHLDAGDQVILYTFQVAGSSGHGSPTFSKYTSYFGGFLLNED